MLTVDRAARTIHGRAVPFDVIGRSKLALPRRFRFGCLIWQDPTPLVIEHDRSLQAGTVIDFTQLEDGLWITALASHGSRGDLALEKAATTHDELSIGITDEEIVIAEDGVVEYISARIAEVTLTKNPVFAQPAF